MGEVPFCPTCNDKMVLKPETPIDDLYHGTTGITGTSTSSMITTEVPLVKSDVGVPDNSGKKPKVVSVRNYICEKCGHEEQLWTRERGVKAL